jgi:hypothetical protein
MDRSSSIDLPRRSTIQETFLAVEFEKATTVTNTEDTGAVSAERTLLQESSSGNEGGHNKGDEENDDGNNTVVSNEGAGVEESRFHGADSRLGLELGRVADDQRNRLQDRGARRHDHSSTRSGVPVASVL